MSLLAFNGTHLIADRKTICQQDPLTNVQYYPKIFKSSCERFAFGGVGLMIKPDQLKIYEEVLIEKIVEYRTGAPVSESTKQYIDVICNKENRSLVVVFNEEGFVLNPEGLTVLSDLEAYGTGGLIFMTAYKLCKDIYKAYYTVEEMVPTVGMPNYEQPDVIELARLKPFIIASEKTTVSMIKTIEGKGK